MITKNFIKTVHEAFDELNYRITKDLNFDNFEKSAIRTLTHCKDLSDSIDAVRMYQFCLKKWNKIEKIFKHKLQQYNQYEYEGNSLISIVSDDESLGTYFITNGINRKIKDIFIASHSFDEEMFALGLTHGKFTVFDDGEYHLKHSNMSSVKMKIFDKKKNCLCNIVLSENLGIFLENNQTPYELVVYDDFVGIFNRNYFETLADDDIIDTEKMLADIEWDILGKKSELGVAKLNVYSADEDLELFLLFATSTFLIFQKYMQSQKTQSFAMMSF